MLRWPWGGFGSLPSWATPSGGHTPLHLAAKEGHAQAVTALLNAGAAPDVRIRKGLSALHLAAMNGHTEAVTALLKDRAAPNAQNKVGDTSLHLAAERNQHPEVITALLDAHAAANVQNAAGKQPFDYAKRNRAIRGSTAHWRLNDARF